MLELCSYNYATIRVVPRVEREEFINVGVIISCPDRKFLEACVALDERRLLAFDSTLDVDLLRTHLDVIPRICAGGEHAGPIGKLSQRERFYWLTAVRSTIIQVSPVHTGLTQDPAAELKRLVEIMVAPR